MSDVTIGKGKIFGKGVFAKRDFRTGEVVIQYRLKPLSKVEFIRLPRSEKPFTHTHWGQIYLYGKPERYVNHSMCPNTYPDLKNQCDVAFRKIKEGEEITTTALEDDVE